MKATGDRTCLLGRIQGLVFAVLLLVAVVNGDTCACSAGLPTIGSEPQLFVDDVMIAAKSGMVRRAHACRKLPQPVLMPEMPWEQEGVDRRVYIYGTVVRDTGSGTFRMWYNRLGSVLLATSNDGLAWERPALGLVEYGGAKDNNILPVRLHSPSVVCDLHEKDPAERYKMVGCCGRDYCAAHSADGLDWKMYAKNPVLPSSDTITMAQDPATGEYLAFHKRTERYLGHIRRLVYLAESTDMQQWTEPKLVMAPDEIDDRQTQAEGGRWSQFYNMSVFPCGGQWLGLVTHFRYSGPPPEKGPGQSGDDGPIDVQLVHSRDGRTWQRCSDRSPVIANGPYAYDAGCILGVANSPVVVGDEVWLYYTAITTTHGGYLPEKVITIALAKWRLDGFVSLDADDTSGVVETVPLRFEGDRLTVNADVSGGLLAVEVLDAEGRPIAGYARADCLPVRGDSVRHEIAWKQKTCLPTNAPVRVRFHVEHGQLYSYRVCAGP